MLFTGVAFGMIGISVGTAIEEVGAELWHAMWVGVVLGLAAIAVRFVWLWLFSKANQRRDRANVAPLRTQEVLVMTWAGMRGLVTLALVLSIPEHTSDTLHHEAAVIALVVLLVTMVVPGLTLPALMRRLDLTETSEPVDRLTQRARDAARRYVEDKQDNLQAETTEAVRNWMKARFDHFDDEHQLRLEDQQRLRRDARAARVGALKAAQAELLRAREERGADVGAVDEVLHELDQLILAAKR